MDYALHWTGPALADFREVITYLVARKPLAAADIRADIIQSTLLLCSFPELGQVYERGQASGIREIISRGYRIFYRINEPAKQVEILRVWHSSRGEPHFSRN